MLFKALPCCQADVINAGCVMCLQSTWQLMTRGFCSFAAISGKFWDTVCLQAEVVNAAFVVSSMA